MTYKLMRYDEHDQTHQVEELWFDGYSIAERQLEGLPIKVTIGSGGALEISADWPKGTDAKYWTKVACDFAQDQDVFSTTAEMNDDDGFIEEFNP